MKAKLLFSILVILWNINVNAQYCTTDTRYTEVETFTNTTNIKTDSDIEYGTALNALGQMESLKLNMIYPKPAIDPSPKRPLMVMIHGGTFLTGNKNQLNVDCREFAKRGFVVATINYRLGWDCTTDPNSYEKAVYRANQDARAALRFIVANAATLNIDTSWIFIGGESAGAATAMGVAYMSQAEWNTAFPALQPMLGGVNTSGNTLTDSYSIKGIFNNWGGVGREFMQVNEMRPTISFHGSSDGTVNIDSALGGSCATPSWVYGSKTIHRELTKAGVCSNLVIKPGGGHGIYKDSPEQIAFRVSKAVCFFKSVFCNSCVSELSNDSIPATCSISTDLAKFDLDSKINLYPNPTKNIVKIDGLNNEDFKITLFDVLGKERFTVVNKKEIDLSVFSTGIYFIKVQQGIKSYSLKILKE